MPKKRIAFEALRKRVLKKISPTDGEAREEKKFALELSDKLARALKGSAEIRFVGSTARDTGLHGDKDIDLFVLFPRALSKEFIVSKTVEATKKTILAEWVMHYAEHPYLRARVGEFEVEVIPCFESEPHEGLKSAVDRSPLHMDFLQKRLSLEQREDVRLLKRFLKNAGLYGAELRVKGFSGLVCEYLILNYRSFWGLVENAVNWRVPTVIDLSGRKSVKQFTEPLVLIDAIDFNRNAAAVVSETNFSKFVSLCRAFYDEPGKEKFFFHEPRILSAKQLLSLHEKRGTVLALVSFTRPGVVEDIFFPQLEKTMRCFKKHLELNNFVVFNAACFATSSQCFLLYEFPFTQLPNARLLRGPPVSDAVAVKRFVKAHALVLRGPFVEGDRVFVEEARDETNAVAFLKKIFAKPSFYGAGSFLVKPLKKSVLSLNEKAFLNLSEEARAEFTAFLAKKDFWL